VEQIVEVEPAGAVGAASLLEGGVEIGGPAAQQLSADPLSGAGFLGVLHGTAAVEPAEAQLGMRFADSLLQLGSEPEDRVGFADLGADSPRLLAQSPCQDLLVPAAGRGVVGCPHGLARGDAKDGGGAAAK